MTTQTTFNKLPIDAVFSFDGNPNKCRKVRATKYRDLTIGKEFGISYQDKSKVTLDPADNLDSVPVVTPPRSTMYRGRSID